MTRRVANRHLGMAVFCACLVFAPGCASIKDRSPMSCDDLAFLITRADNGFEIRDNGLRDIVISRRHRLQARWRAQCVMARPAAPNPSNIA